MCVGCLEVSGSQREGRFSAFVVYKLGINKEMAGKRTIVATQSFRFKVAVAVYSSNFQIGMWREGETEHSRMRHTLTHLIYLVRLKTQEWSDVDSCCFRRLHKVGKPHKWWSIN